MKNFTWEKYAFIGIYMVESSKLDNNLKNVPFYQIQFENSDKYANYLNNHNMFQKGFLFFKGFKDAYQISLKGVSIFYEMEYCTEPPCSNSKICPQN